MIELSDKDIDGMIIDLRNNSGGYVRSASDIANEFLEKGTIEYDADVNIEDYSMKNMAKKFANLLNGLN